MKTLSTSAILLIVSMWCYTTSAQNIISLSVVPPAPTTADTILLLSECSFPSGSCVDHTQAFFISGNDIFANALHCLGMLSVICNYTDTIILNPLPAGNYTFHFQLDAGFGPSPCTPGIVPGPADSINFVVAPFTKITEYISNDAVSVFPNPFIDSFQLIGIDQVNFPVYLEIFATDGKLIKATILKDSGSEINLKELPAASYQIYLTTKNKERILIPAIKK